MLIDGHYPPEPLSVSTGVEEEIIQPQVIRKKGPDSHTAVCAAANPVHLPQSPPMREPIIAAEAIHPLSVNLAHIRASKYETSRSLLEPARQLDPHQNEMGRGLPRSTKIILFQSPQEEAKCESTYTAVDLSHTVDDM